MIFIKLVSIAFHCYKLLMVLMFSIYFMQEKAAFIFCVEDRALFCKDCDEPIHSASSLSANHQRFLATGIRVAPSSSCTTHSEKSYQEPKPPNHKAQEVPTKTPTPQASSVTSPAWAVDDSLRFSDFESSEKVRVLLSY